MRVVWGAFCLAFLAAQPAAAAEWTGWYLGGGLTETHHTGYTPGNLAAIEKYQSGGKGIVGYRFLPRAQVEFAYHYLGEASFFEGSPVLSRERSRALVGSLIYVSPPLSDFGIPTLLPMNVLLRVGLGYKRVRHAAFVGTFHEGFLAANIGAALEILLTKTCFIRIEYEFINKSFGGTNRVIDVMHTPLAVTIGLRM
jgi:hypothetical protein